MGARTGLHAVFNEHAWIEPGETVTDDVLLQLAVPEGEPVAFETRLVWEWAGADGNCPRSFKPATDGHAARYLAAAVARQHCRCS
jgi:hypothetical protein